MGRPSKLTDVKWEQVYKKLLNNVSISEISKEFKISRAQIYARFPDAKQKIKKLGNQIVMVQDAFNNLTITDKLAISAYIEELKITKANLNKAAANASVATLKMSSVAVSQANKIDVDNPMDNMEGMQALSAAIKIMNDASILGLKIIDFDNKVKESSMQVVNPPKPLPASVEEFI